MYNLHNSHEIPIIPNMLRVFELDFSIHVSFKDYV